MSDHHLSPAADHHHHHTSAAILSPQFQEPVTRMSTLHPSPSTATATDYRLLGFTKLPLPHSFPTASLPPLRRTISEPIYSPDTVNSPVPPPEFTISPALNQSRQFPNSTTALQRTISDPYPVVGAATDTPPRHPEGRKASRSPSCGESPSTKRLKRMRERLKEMSQWWNEVVSEGDDEDDTETDNDRNHNIPKEDSEDCTEIPSQEDVWIETKGECLVLNFKCPCSKGYEVLLSGNNCYYKLTGF